MMTILIFIAVLSLLVFVHEFGHFITAKRAGVKVEEFGFGFPPRLAGIKKGGTIYSINWIPLGGFVKIKGESGEYSRDKDSFANKSAPRRALILCAGVLMNIVLAWFLLSIGFLIGLPQVIDELPAYASVADAKVQVVSVLKDSPAEKGGLETGDEVLALDGAPIRSAEDVRAYAEGHSGEPVAVRVKREGEVIEKTVTPEYLEFTGKVAIGVALVKTGLVSYPLHIAPIQGLVATWAFGKEIILAFAGMLRDLVVTQKVTVELSGPVGIAFLTAEVTKLGIRYLLQFTALLSLNLAIINILPFPALDGGRMLFLIIEKARGHAMSRRIEMWAHNVGFALLMILVLVVTYRDVVRFGDRIMEGLAKMLTG